MCNGEDWQGLIGKVIENEASDIHMTVGQRPYMRCRGMLSAMDTDPLTERFMSDFCAVILSEAQRERLARDRGIDLSWTYAGRRFRVNAYYQQGFPALAIRLLPERIPSLAAFIEELNREKSYHIVTLEEINSKDLIQMYESL